MPLCCATVLQLLSYEACSMRSPGQLQRPLPLSNALQCIPSTPSCLSLLMPQVDALAGACSALGRGLRGVVTPSVLDTMARCFSHEVHFRFNKMCLFFAVGFPRGSSNGYSLQWPLRQNANCQCHLSRVASVLDSLSFPHARS